MIRKMVKTARILQARFHFGQKVKISSNKEAYICGAIYYSDVRQWHYALSFSAQNYLPEETWYWESELCLPDD